MLALDLLFLEIPPRKALSPRAHLGEATMGIRGEFGVHARLGFLQPFPVYVLGSSLSWPRYSLPYYNTSYRSSPCQAVLAADPQPCARPAARSCCPSIEAVSPNPNHPAALPCFDSPKIACLLVACLYPLVPNHFVRCFFLTMNLASKLVPKISRARFQWIWRVS